MSTIYESPYFRRISASGGLVLFLVISRSPSLVKSTTVIEASEAAISLTALMNSGRFMFLSFIKSTIMIPEMFLKIICLIISFAASRFTDKNPSLKFYFAPEDFEVLTSITVRASVDCITSWAPLLSHTFSDDSSDRFFFISKRFSSGSTLSE